MRAKRYGGRGMYLLITAAPLRSGGRTFRFNLFEPDPADMSLVKRLIIVEGNISAGKSTLCRMLSDELNYALFLEPTVENPFLDRFYKEPRKFALPMQLWLLKQRYITYGARFRGPAAAHPCGRAPRRSPTRATRPDPRSERHQVPVQPAQRRRRGHPGPLHLQRHRLRGAQLPGRQLHPPRLRLLPGAASALAVAAAAAARRRLPGRQARGLLRPHSQHAPARECARAGGLPRPAIIAAAVADRARSGPRSRASPASRWTTSRASTSATRTC